MSRSNIQWQICINDTAEYESEVDGSALFERIISLWKEYPNAISNRVNTMVAVESGSDLWNEVLGEFQSRYGEDPRNRSELSVNKFILNSNNAQREFSENSFEVSYFEEAFLARFYPIVLDGARHPHFESPYSIGCLCPSPVSLELQLFRAINAPEEHYTFMRNSAFKTLIKWLRTVDLTKVTRKTNEQIDKEIYAKSYRSLREEHGRPICEQWTENSDPKKAVFEDCGIATYIQGLVEADVLPKPKKYVDIGCGNGLLVHLLNKIGFKGYGVDVRHRLIWKTMFKHEDLRETAVNPQFIVQNEPHFDADVDLLIGNHSDELTPWIPVMAAKLNCNFFLIPCCPFNFFGKYVNNGSHLGRRRLVSQYESFFEWTVTVAERLGFQIKLDRLAIPSTKRLCIIGRVPKGGLCPDIDATIHIMTEGKQFVARPQEIKNNNCMNIPRVEREKISKKVFDFLLNSSEETRDGWHCGAEVPLSELATILTDDEKKFMKDQDGGLQTFLRNHHQIFHVHHATARIRDFRQPVVSKRKSWKPKKASTTKASCWMAANHPDGCPVGEEACHYAH